MGEHWHPVTHRHRASACMIGPAGRTANKAVDPVRVARSAHQTSAALVGQTGPSIYSSEFRSSVRDSARVQHYVVKRLAACLAAHRRGGRTHPAKALFHNCIALQSTSTLPGLQTVSSGEIIVRNPRPPRFTTQHRNVCKRHRARAAPRQAAVTADDYDQDHQIAHHLARAEPASWLPRQASHPRRLPGSRYDRLSRAENRLRRFRVSTTFAATQFRPINPIIPELLPYHLTLAADGAPIRFGPASRRQVRIG